MKVKLDGRTLRTLIVVAVFGVLLAYVLLIDNQREPPPPEDATPTPYPILQLGVGELAGVRASDGQRTLRFEREEEGWQIVESPTGQGPGEMDLSAASVSLAELSGLAAKEQILEQVADPAPFGLAPPALTLAAWDQSGQEVQLQIGRKTPDGTSYYVQRQGDPALYIVASYKISPFFEWLADPPYLPTPTADAQ